MSAPAPRRKDMTVEKWKAFAAQTLRCARRRISPAFPVRTDDEAVRAADDYTTEQFIALGNAVGRGAGKGREPPVYRYHFELPAPPSEMHPEGEYAWHSDELEYVLARSDARKGAEWRRRNAN